MTIRDIAIAFGYEVDEQSEKKANESIDKLKSVATKALGAIGIGFSLVNANEIITEFGKINAQIQNATKDLSDQRAIQDQIIAAANEARASYADIANITSKLVQQNSDLFDVAGAARYAELTTKLFKSENKEQGDILALQDAINVSFAKGAVEAETIGQIIEQSPAAADLLARHIGAARSELEQMASDGKISLEQLRDAFLNNADEIEAAFGNVDLTISDALLNIRNQWGLWLAQMDKTLGVTKTIAKVMTRTFTQFMNVLRKVQTYTERFVKKVGGAENALKLLAMAAGAIFIALNAGKILDFLKNAKSLLTGINLKTVALVAAILLIALAIDDFINFMQGNDSVIGVIFEKWGIDADEVRKRIIEAWEGIKAFLLRTWAAIKDIFKGVLQFLTGVFTGDWEKAFGGLKSIAGNAVSYIENVFGKFAPIVKAVAVAFASWKAIKTAFGFVKGAATAISKLSAVTKKASVVTKGLGTAFKFLTSPAGLAVIAIAALAAVIIMLIKNGGDVDALVQQFSDGLNKFTGIIEKVVAGIAEKAPQIVEAIVNAITKVLNVIVEKLPMFIDMGIKLITSLINGIVKMLPVVVSTVVKLAAAILTAIVNLLPKLIDAGVKLITSLIDGIVSMLPSIIEAVVKLITALVDALAGLLPKLIEAGVLLITSLIEGIVSALPQIIAALVGLIPVLIKAITDSLPKLIKAGIQIILSLVKGIVGAIPQIIKAVVGLIPVIVKALLDAVGDFFTGIWNGIAGFFKSVWDGLLVVVNTFVAVFKAAFTTVSDFFKGIWNGLADFFTGIWDGIKSVFSTVADFFTGIFTKAAEGIKSAFSGIKDFFSSVFQAVANAVKAPINWIIGGINNFIGGLNKIKIPDWVPGVGGKGFSLPTIPQLARGGVLEKGQTGYLEGNGAEAVVPLEKNTEWIKKVAGLFRQQMSENGAAGTDNGINGIVEAVKGVGGVVGSAIKTVAEKAAGAKANADSNGFTDALRSFGANLTSLVKGATASPGTVQSMVTSTTNRSVTQNNYFENTFNGDRAGQQRSSEAMGKNTADATGQLARALAFAR